MTLSFEQVVAKVDGLKRRYSARDQQMLDVLSIRTGDTRNVFPDHFSDTWPRPITANFIDLAARDISEGLAPLPAFNCSNANMISDRAKKAADKRSRIVHFYVQHSRLSVQMYTACDRFVTYGFLPFYIEPDWDDKTPRITAEDPMGCYPEYDRFGHCTGMAKMYTKTAGELAQMFPDHAVEILGKNTRFWNDAKDQRLTVVRWVDDTQIVLYIRDKNVPLEAFDHGYGFCPVEVARRPGVEDDPRGQFDDVIWVQLAKNKLAMLKLDAAYKAVNAPFVVPDDMQEMPIGPDAVWRTQNPGGVHRAGLEMAPGAFQEEQVLDKELHDGSRYPDARQGGINASVVTGKGVEALLGGYDGQIKAGQDILSEALRNVVHKCFRMDEALWPDVSRTIRGTMNATPFDETYVPAKDIAGDYTVDVTYGFAAGLDPNRALVFLLQLRGDKAIPREFMLRQMPFDIDVSKIMEDLDVEETRDALKQGVFAYLQSLGPLAEQGQDPSAILSKVANIIDRRQKGDSYEKAVAQAFAPPPAPPAPPGGDQGAAPPGGPGGAPGIPDGVQPNGLPEGVQPGQAGMPPGGRSPLQMLVAGLGNSGQPNLQANETQRIGAA